MVAAARLRPVASAATCSPDAWKARPATLASRTAASDGSSTAVRTDDASLPAAADDRDPTEDHYYYYY